MEKAKGKSESAKVEGPAACVAQSCKKKSERSSFCNEHFLWFKAGLIKKDGTYPKDFDKKYVQYIRRAS